MRCLAQLSHNSKSTEVRNEYKIFQKLADRICVNTEAGRRFSLAVCACFVSTPPAMPLRQLRPSWTVMDAVPLRNRNSLQMRQIARRDRRHTHARGALAVYFGGERHPPHLLPPSLPPSLFITSSGVWGRGKRKGGGRKGGTRHEGGGPHPHLKFVGRGI